MKTDKDNQFISVVMPIYNEEKYISNCIESLLLQDYPIRCQEWIFVDGGSTDQTKTILETYVERYPDLIKIYDNPNKYVPYGMNIGIEHAAGMYIIRLDAHAKYNKDYISKCVYYLNSTGSDNVGGIAITKGLGKTGEAIANILSSKFGVGNSKFRTGSSSGYVDTVPFGAFKRDVFLKWGGYDTRLIRNQDNEMNYRIRKNGGKIYLSSDIQFEYYCRDSVRGIVDMAVKNGMWNIITMWWCPGTMGMRHFIPLVFLLSLFILLGFGMINTFFWNLLLVEMMLYFAIDLFYSFRKTLSLMTSLQMFVLYPIFHLSYGFGSIKGLVKLRKLKNEKGKGN